MAITFEEAVREKIKLHIGLIGPSGAGKTYTALELATGLADGGEIILIDSESGRGKHYAGRFKYKYCQLTAPFSPERYIEYLNAAYAQKPAVVIVDSASHEWIGKGGVLELKDQLGGKFQAWEKLTPRHMNFITCITNSPCHVIVTMRGKDQYVMSEKDGENDRKKQEVKKVGIGAQMRDGFEYECEVSFLIDNPTHVATVVKDLDGLFGNFGEVLSQRHGQLLAEWANSGNQPAQRAQPAPQAAASKPAPSPTAPAPAAPAAAQASKQDPAAAPALGETAKRLDAFISNATTLDELRATAAEIKEAVDLGDINDKERAGLQAHYKNKKAKLEREAAEPKPAAADPQPAAPAAA